MRRRSSLPSRCGRSRRKNDSTVAPPTRQKLKRGNFILGQRCILLVFIGAQETALSPDGVPPLLVRAVESCNTENPDLKTFSRRQQTKRLKSVSWCQENPLPQLLINTCVTHNSAWGVRIGRCCLPKKDSSAVKQSALKLSENRMHCVSDYGPFF